MEAYVDDVLIKTNDTPNFYENIRETLTTLQQHGVNLNLKKCSFCVETGKFLGYIISPKGVEANSYKIQALLDIKPLASVKEVQQFT